MQSGVMGNFTHSDFIKQKLYWNTLITKDQHVTFKLIQRPHCSSASQLILHSLFSCTVPVNPRCRLLFTVLLNPVVRQLIKTCQETHLLTTASVTSDYRIHILQSSALIFHICYTALAYDIQCDTCMLSLAIG